jgi:rare lipoprotein A
VFLKNRPGVPASSIFEVFRMTEKTGRRLLAGATCLLLLLAGCGGPAKYGAYYKNDGPADKIPGDLDSIPDARPRPEPLHRFANRPYVVLGKSYVPNTTLKPLRQRGIASWYGRKFHGQKTSIGETYDMFAMTAAHPTLALPSYARVTHLGNGRSVVVRVIDRGPFIAGRVIDLSYAAAHRLGYINEGSARVEVEALLPGEATPPPRTGARFPVPSENPATVDGHGRIFLQLGAFSSADNAESLRAHLARELDWLDEEIGIQAGGDGIYRVQLGPCASRATAGRIAERIRSVLGAEPVFVTR